MGICPRVPEATVGPVMDRLRWRVWACRLSEGFWHFPDSSFQTL